MTSSSMLYALRCELFVCVDAASLEEAMRGAEDTIKELVKRNDLGQFNIKFLPPMQANALQDGVKDTDTVVWVGHIKQ
jgi:hypothetical protein